MISIDDRMKDFYEKRNRNFLIRRMPVIIRIDGKAFHTYTKGLDKPFDSGLIEDMQCATKYLCENIQGCKFGYVQSDEISLLLTDYDTLQTDAWFDYCQNKMESIGASLASSKFLHLRIIRGIQPTEDGNWIRDFIDDLTLPNFDARAFNIPREEVCNYFIFRQNDCVKNSIIMLAQSLYPHKDLQGKNTNEMQELCWQKGINWNELPAFQKRGTAVYKQEVRTDLTGKTSIEKVERNDTFWQDSEGRYGVMTDQFVIDLEPPTFSQDRSLIENLV